MIYRLFVDFWDDPRVRNLNANEKLIAVYLLTTPFGHYSGLFTIPLGDAAAHMDLSKRQVVAGIQTLSCGNRDEEPFLKYDEDRQMLWIPFQLERQIRGKHLNELQRKRLTGYVRRLPRSPLLQQFLHHYQDILGDSLEGEFPVVIQGKSNKRSCDSSSSSKRMSQIFRNTGIIGNQEERSPIDQDDNCHTPSRMPYPIGKILLRAIEKLPEPQRTSIIDGLRDVSEGKTTPEETRTKLIEIFGLAPSLASKIFPDDGV